MEARSPVGQTEQTPSETSHMAEAEVTKPVLPSYLDLVALYEEIEKSELELAGKDSITELPEPCRHKLQLVDAMIYYLNNFSLLKDREDITNFPEKEEDLNAEQKKRLEDIRIENRDILAGVMLFISTEGNNVYSKFDKGLAAFTPTDKRYALFNFIKCYTANAIPDIEGPKSTKEIFSVVGLLKALPNEVMLEFKQKHQSVIPTQIESTQPAVSGRSYLNWFTWGLFGSSGTPSTAPVVQETKEHVARPNG